MASTMRLIKEQTVSEGALRADTSRYFLYWRTRANHPWHSLEFDDRARAYRRYFAMIERGIEAFLQRRPPTSPE